MQAAVTQIQWFDYTSYPKKENLLLFRKRGYKIRKSKTHRD